MTKLYVFVCHDNVTAAHILAIADSSLFVASPRIPSGLSSCHVELFRDP